MQFECLAGVRVGEIEKARISYREAAEAEIERTRRRRTAERGVSRKNQLIAGCRGSVARTGTSETPGGVSTEYYRSRSRRQ